MHLVRGKYFPSVRLTVSVGSSYYIYVHITQAASSKGPSQYYFGGVSNIIAGKKQIETKILVLYLHNFFEH